MENCINISSKSALDGLLSELFNTFPENIIYAYIEDTNRSRKKPRYFVSIKYQGIKLIEKISNFLARLMIKDYEREFMSIVLKEYFIDFSNFEKQIILDKAQKSIVSFNNFYLEKIFVKKITKHLLEFNNISLEGFLQFRVPEYRRIVQMILSNAIEELLVEQEYNEFIELIKFYINASPSDINLLHIKVNCDGSFSLYDFKKSEILFSNNQMELTEKILTESDKLLSILISTAPKRIIWHDNSKIDNKSLINTIKEIFGERFSECIGCEFCSSEKNN